MGIRIRTATTYKSLESPDGFCRVVADFKTTSLYSLLLRITVQVSLVIPFVNKAWQLRNSRSEAKKLWRHMSLVNVVVTCSIIGLELLAYFLPNIPLLKDWSNASYAIINFCEANLVLFMMEDTKMIMREGQQPTP